MERCEAASAQRSCWAARRRQIRHVTQEALRRAYTLLETAPARAGPALPEVEIVDMRKELERTTAAFSPEALTLRLGGNPACRDGRRCCFINRRGYASFVKCRACGYTSNCPHCDVTHDLSSDGR